MTPEPVQTLIDAVEYFADPKVCFEAMLPVKWPDGKPKCPKCNGDKVGIITSRSMLQCKAKDCRKQFSVKVGTIFEDSPLPLQQWFVAVWCIANAKNGISSHELSRALGVTQKTAWFMLHRIRLAMRTKSFGKLKGEVEVDETFIGGKAANMHKSVREKKIKGRGAIGKAIVQGLIQRDGEARCEVVANTVAPFHLHRYVDEQTWRFNARKTTDGNRFKRVLAAVVGKRITYRLLTAQNDAGFMGLK